MKGRFVPWSYYELRGTFVLSHVCDRHVEKNHVKFVAYNKKSSMEFSFHM